MKKIRAISSQFCCLVPLSPTPSQEDPESCLQDLAYPDPPPLPASSLSCTHLTPHSRICLWFHRHSKLLLIAQPWAMLLLCREIPPPLFTQLICILRALPRSDLLKETPWSFPSSPPSTPFYPDSQASVRGCSCVPTCSIMLWSFPSLVRQPHHRPLTIARLPEGTTWGRGCAQWVIC